MINGLLLLFKFSTKIPIISPKSNDKELGKSMKFFPVVGIVLGIVLFAFYKLLNGIITTRFSMAATLVSIELILTGAIHFEGLAAVFNAIFKYRSKQKMLDMLKENNPGATGVLVLVVIIILKIVFIAEARTPIGPTFLLLPVMGRLSCLLNCATNPAARSTGIGKTFADNTKFKDFLVGLGITIGYFTFLLLLTENFSIHTMTMGLILGLIFGFVLILSFLFGKWMNKRIGGITGDTLGAVIELTEVATAMGIYFISSRLVERGIMKLFF